MDDPPFDLSKFDPSSLNLSHLYPAEQNRIKNRQFTSQEISLLLSGQNPWTESGKPKPLPSPPQPKQPTLDDLRRICHADTLPLLERGDPGVRAALEAQWKAANPPPPPEEDDKPRASFTDDDRDFPLPHENRSFITGAKRKVSVLRVPPETLSKPAEGSEPEPPRIEFSSEIKRHKGWYLFAFIGWGFPVGLAAIWPMLVRDKTLPEWLAAKGWPSLTALVLGWLAGLCVIALVITVRSLLTARNQTSNLRSVRDTKKLQQARKLKEYQEAGEKILKRCAREALAPVVQICNWQDQVEAYIRENIGEFQAIEFSKSAPITVYPNMACNRDLTNKLYTQIERIGQIISELRP